MLAFDFLFMDVTTHLFNQREPIQDVFFVQNPPPAHKNAISQPAFCPVVIVFR